MFGIGLATVGLVTVFKNLGMATLISFVFVWASFQKKSGFVSNIFGLVMAKMVEAKLNYTAQCTVHSM